MGMIKKLTWAWLALWALQASAQPRAALPRGRSGLLQEIQSLEKILPIIEETEKLKGLIRNLEKASDWSELDALSRAINAQGGKEPDDDDEDYYADEFEATRGPRVPDFEPLLADYDEELDEPMWDTADPRWMM